MQLKIKTILDEPLQLPVAYHHIQQAIIYKLMGDSKLHDGGYSYNNRVFKMFTFGPFNGNSRIEDGKIEFCDSVSMEFRCALKSISEKMVLNISGNGIMIGEKNYRDVIVTSSDKKIESEDIIIRMLSPITVRYTAPNSNKTIYYNPGDDEFRQAVINNYKRKYNAFTEGNSAPELLFDVIDVRSEDKYLTRYKDFIIEGYMGTYRLRGCCEALDFLYNVGLGSKNSQGFGMFDIVTLS